MLGLGLWVRMPARAEEHHATNLGNPATRFAPPLKTPDDLRARFADPKLKPDFASVLRQWRWVGDPEDMHRAAASAEIREHEIAVGAVMPFMSTRKNGHPICLINVHWKGRVPAPAYAFDFTSRGRRYRCITPKACSNFFVEDLGTEPKAVLAIDCQVPAELMLGRPLEVCLNVRNTGDAPGSNVLAALELPPGVRLTSATEGGLGSDGRVVWPMDQLAAGASRKLCATLSAAQLGALPFQASLSAARMTPVRSSCSSTVSGISAILLELVDLADPIEVGKEVTYEIKVINQGSAPGTNIRIHCNLPASQEFVSATGTSPTTREEQRLIMETLPLLAPKATASWRVIVKALKEDDARFRVELSSDQFEKPINEEEPTQQY